MKSDFYVHLSALDSKEYFPDNQVDHFTVKLPEILHLDGNWQVALCEIFHPYGTRPQVLLALTNICNDTIVGEKKLPLLRIFRTPKRQGHIEFSQLHYKSVTVEAIDRITIYIKTVKGEDPSFTSKALSCTLHFQPLQN